MTGGQLANPTSIFCPLLPDLSPVRMPETILMLLFPRCPCSENWTCDTVSSKEVGCLSTTPVFPYKEAATAGAALSTFFCCFEWEQDEEKAQRTGLPHDIPGPRNHRQLPILHFLHVERIKACSVSASVSWCSHCSQPKVLLTIMTAKFASLP